MAIKPRTQQERRDTTRQAVLDSASALFGARGYQNTALEDIALDCGTTIRPIYHYYNSKKNLFLVVTEQMEHALFEQLQALRIRSEKPASLGEYWDTFTTFSANAAFRQIVLVDAPTVLGRDRWEHGPVVTFIIDLLCPLFPQLRHESRMLVARMVIAALTEAALSLSEPGNTDKERAFEEVSGLIKTFAGFLPRT